MLLVNSSYPFRTILQRRKHNERNIGERNETYMTKPTGKTNPPRILTIPGLVAVNPAAPPEIISDNNPPKDSMTPARNYMSSQHYS